MPDAKTIAFYDASADRYAELVKADAPSDSLLKFMALLPKGGTVLDLGCGPAHASAQMRDAGFTPDPVDASQGMIDLANETYQIGARLLTFSELNAADTYDGVWANFSLLHAPRQHLPRILLAIAKSLRSNGIFHIGMKTGKGQQRDAIDRLYTYVTPSELQELLEYAGFSVLNVKEGEEVGCAGTKDPFVEMRARKND